MIDAFLTVLIIESKDNFGIRVRTERVPLFFEKLALFLEVVNLTIKDEFVTVEITHGLMPERREVNDSKTSVAKPNFLVG